MASTAATAKGHPQAGAAPDMDAAADADRPHIETRNRGILFFAIMAAALLQILDTTIANVALPHMQAALGATSDSISWVLTSYIVASAIALPTTGWLSGRIGTRPLLLISVACFIGFSALCGLAVNLTEIVLFRLGQGVAGAFIMPLSQSVMLDVTKPSQHGTAMMIWAMGIMAGPIAGPILGGYLTENFDWRWVFFVNVPVGLMALALLVIHLPHWEKVKVRFDRVGYVLIALAIAALQLLLDRGEQVDWFDAGESWLYLAIMLSCGWAAVAHLAMARDPLFDRTLFRDRNFNVALVVIMVVGLCLMATLALLPPLLQNLLGYSVLETGLVMCPRGIGVLLCMPVSQWLTRRNVDMRLIVGGGFVIVGISMFEMSHWSLDVDARHIVLTGLLQGIGIGLTFLPLNNLAFATLPARVRATASSLLNLSRSIGSSIGISVVVTLLARSVQINHLEMAEQLTPETLGSANLGALSRIEPLGPAAMQIIDGEINRQAAMIGYINDFWLMGIACFATLPLIMLIRPAGKNGAPPPVDPGH
jgi:MFS transporter, DHA2 family, multidrug resistance protein